MNKLKWCFVCICAVLSTSAIVAQGNDTSVFFRYAATFDQLLPAPYYPAQDYMPDTASLLILNCGPVNMSLQKQVSLEEHRGDLQKTEDLGIYKYVWDAQGRIVRYQEFYPGENEAHLNVGFSFLAPSKLQQIIAVEGNNVDSAKFQYNRSGVIGTWSRHKVGGDSSYVISGTRMYDSRQRVIVATNMKYGPLPGSYIYEYNNDGQLIRRAFLAGGTGVILCTDTLEYAFQSESHSVLLVTHKLKVTGAEKWTTIESENIYPYSDVLLSYTDNNDADSNYFYRNYPEYTVRYEYDEKGRVTTEYFGTLVAADQIIAKYYYSTQIAPDSIVYSERISEKKSSYMRVYSRDVRSYDNNGKIVNRTIITYLFDEKKKKDLSVPYEVVNITYSWQ